MFRPPCRQSRRAQTIFSPSRYRPSNCLVPSAEPSRIVKRHATKEGRLDVVRGHLASLTPREREVFELVVRGKTNKHIGLELGTTERTIKAHRHRVMEKMQVQSLAELASLAERIGTLANGSSRSSLSYGTKGKPMRAAYRIQLL
jgi:DNA-binding NarL/FixJ family response regulator